MNPTPLCRHIKSDGIVCKSPALRGKSKCYYHQPRPAASDPTAERRYAYRQYALRGLKPEEFQHLIALGDKDAINRALSVVIAALAADEIHPRRAGAILYALQMASRIQPRPR
jgi:hypothetical protein